MTYDDQMKIVSDVLVGLSWLCIIFAIYGFVAGSALFNIASTQWLLISVILVANAVYLSIAGKKIK